MGNPTFLDKARGFIGGIAWRVFLWSIRMTNDQYMTAIEIDAIARWESLREAVKSGNPTMRYWQHDETGRVCKTVLQPSERWYEIPKGAYDNIVGAMVNHEPKPERI